MTHPVVFWNFNLFSNLHYIKTSYILIRNEYNASRVPAARHLDIINSQLYYKYTAIKLFRKSSKPN